MRSRCCLCVCLCIPPPIVARQRLGRNGTAAKNTHVIEILLDASFFNVASVVSRKVRD
jgi:hypothetical protein